MVLDCSVINYSGIYTSEYKVDLRCCTVYWQIHKNDEEFNASQAKIIIVGQKTKQVINHSAWNPSGTRYLNYNSKKSRFCVSHWWVLQFFLKLIRSQNFGICLVMLRKLAFCLSYNNILQCLFCLIWWYQCLCMSP